MTSKAKLQSMARDAAKLRAEYEHPAKRALFHVVDHDTTGRECRRMLTAGADSFRHLPDRQPGTRSRYIYLAERGEDVPKPKPLRALRTAQSKTLDPWRKVAERMIAFYQKQAENSEGFVWVSLFDESKSKRQVAAINAEVRGCLRSGSVKFADRFRFRYVDPADWGLA
jgi:hypothetical protein